MPVSSQCEIGKWDALDHDPDSGIVDQLIWALICVSDFPPDSFLPILLSVRLEIGPYILV